jgi:hypothetical protein
LNTNQRIDLRERKRRQNAFNGRLRDELLNETLFPLLSHLRTTVASWRADCDRIWRCTQCQLHVNRRALTPPRWAKPTVRVYVSWMEVGGNVTFRGHPALV